MVEDWKRVFRDGFVPVVSLTGLQALAKAIEDDDPKLLQGATTEPPPLMAVSDWPVQKACALGFCGWADGLETVGEVENYFCRATYEIDILIGESGGVRHFLNTFDSWSRPVMRSELLPEVERAIKIKLVETAS